MLVRVEKADHAALVKETKAAARAFKQAGAQAKKNAATRARAAAVAAVTTSSPDLGRFHPMAATVRFSQRLSGDHLVLDLREDECGFDDVAYLGRADGDVPEGAPAFLQEGEAAFALVAQAAE